MLRPAQAGDRKFIADSWISSFRNSPWAGMVRNSLWRTIMDPEIDRLLDTVPVVCAVNPQDQEQIFGWVAYVIGPETPILHYLYVKTPFRDHKAEFRPKIGRQLLEHVRIADGEPFEFTFRTPQWDRYARKWRLNGKHRPALIRDDRHFGLSHEENANP